MPRLVSLVFTRTVLLAFLACLWAWMCVTPSLAAVTARVSLSGSGSPGNGNSRSTAISADGRYVAFASEADNLVAGDSNYYQDIFLRDIQQPTTERVSIATSGAQADGSSDFPVVSADGRYVAFVSTATNLVAGDTNGYPDIFLRDRVNRTTERVSLKNGGGQSESGACWAPAAISGDGRYIAFASGGNDFVAGDSNGYIDVYVYDRTTRATVRASVASTGAQANGDSGFDHFTSAPIGVAISADGRYIAFASFADNLASGDSDANASIFLRDRIAANTTLVSVDSNGISANDQCFNPAISADGQVIAFWSEATNLAGGDVNGLADVFVRDRGTARTSRIPTPYSTIAGSPHLRPDDYRRVAINADGRYVAFRSTPGFILGSSGAKYTDVFLYDRVSQSTTLLSISTTGGAGDEDAGVSGVAICGDGRRVAFDAWAGNLVPNDAVNGYADVFTRDWGAFQPDLLIRNPGEILSDGNDIYNVAASQTRTQGVGAGQAAVYFLTAQNDGNVTDTLTITGPAGSSGWTVKYFDALSDGNEITAQVTAKGWPITNLAVNASQSFRVEVTPGSTVATGAARQVVVTATSKVDGTKSDSVVTATTRPALTAVKLAAACAAPQPVQTPITLTASPVGGRQVEYQFRAGYQANNVWHWTVVREYSILPTCTWIPTVAATYTLAVWAREIGSTSAYQVYASQYYKVIPPPLTAVTLAVSPQAPCAVRTPVTLGVSPVGGQRVEYQFRAGYQVSGVWYWTVVRGYSTVPTCTWTPTVTATYTLAVWARETGSASAYQVYASQYYKVVSQLLTAVTLAVSPRAPRIVQTPITLTASPVGGQQAEYQFRAGYQVSGVWHWTVVRGYSTVPTGTWTPTGAATYTLAVWARETGSTSAYQVYASQYYTVTASTAGASLPLPIAIAP